MQNTFIDSYSSESDSGDLTTRSCPPAFPGLADDETRHMKGGNLSMNAPAWITHVLCRVSCRPLHILEIVAWKRTLQRLNSKQVDAATRAKVLKYKRQEFFFRKAEQLCCAKILLSTTPRNG